LAADGQPDVPDTLRPRSVSLWLVSLVRCPVLRCAAQNAELFTLTYGALVRQARAHSLRLALELRPTLLAPNPPADTADTLLSNAAAVLPRRS
jgi:hypothetical protein